MIFNLMMSSAESSPLVNITWKNDDGSIIDTTQVPLGQMPSHDAPVSSAYYRDLAKGFQGWEPALTEATTDTTYTAKFELNNEALEEESHSFYGL